MGKKGKKKGKKRAAHVLLEKPNTLDLGEQLSVPDVFAQYMLPEMNAGGRRPSTISNCKRAVRRFAEWWNTLCEDPLPVAVIRRKHLDEFREWLGTQGCKIPTQNEACGIIRQVLRCAERHELIERAPQIERKHHIGRAAKLYFSFEDVEALWKVLHKARWPRRDSLQMPLPYSAEQFWKSALVLYSIYGFRTQELVRLESHFRPLLWDNIYTEALTPNPAGRMESEHGWISYVPQKQERLKSDPVTVPLTPHTRAAIDCLVDGTPQPWDAVFDVSMSSVNFYHEWHRLVEFADIKPRAGSGVERYQIKHLRKTATTWLNNHQPGLGPHVVGHASDRSGQGASTISERHYANHEEAVVKGLASFQPPACFDELLGEH